MGLIEGSCSPFHFDNEVSRGLVFKNYFNLLDPESLHKQKVDYVILHKHLYDEMPAQSIVPLSFLNRSLVNMAPYISYFTRVYGSPIFEDTWVSVFDVQNHRNPGTSILVID